MPRSPALWMSLVLVLAGCGSLLELDRDYRLGDPQPAAGASGSSGQAGAGQGGASGAAGQAGAAGQGGSVGKGCQVTEECGPGQYCDFPDGLCGAGMTGACKAKPNPLDCVCTIDGVCGCDGATYCDNCSAAQAGVDVQPLKKCRLLPQ